MALFKYTVGTQVLLQKNAQHQFAMQHAINLYNFNSVYSFIPKNACSTLRVSAAIANGCIDNVEQGHWIHKNNRTFIPTLSEATRARYKFVILRCPFRRLASVFLDKFVAKEVTAWTYRDVLGQRINLDNLTFESFVLSLRKSFVFRSDIHWRPQFDFLLYEEYSDYFSLENFSEVVEVLKEKINLNIVDARQLTSHGLDDYEILNDKNYSQSSTFDIALLKRKGLCPSHASLYSPKLIEIVVNLYEQDFTLYNNKCNSNDLLFPI